MAATTGANGNILLSEKRLLTPDNCLLAHVDHQELIPFGVWNVGGQGVIGKELTLAKAGLKMKRDRQAWYAVVSHFDIRRMSEAAQLPFTLLFRQSGLELLLTTVLLFGVTTIVRFAIGPSILSRTIPQIHLQLLIVGAIVALLLSGLIISRPGKISGGHMNPAISLAMWRFGVFPAAGVAPYITAQLLGSIIGVLSARAAWGAAVEQPPVLYAVIRPAAPWSAAPLFAAELVGMAAIVFTVGYCLSNPRLARAVPWLVGILVGLGIVLLGTQTGGSLNPARQFGPAVISGCTAELWVFLVAPMIGAEIAARLLQAFQKRGQVLTHRLCGTHPDGRPLDDSLRETGPVVNPAS